MSSGIAPLVLADADDIAVLQNRLWRVTYAGLLPEEVLAARDDEANRRVWRERAAVHERQGRSLEGARTWVAHDEVGRPIGWSSAGPPRDEDPPTEVELWSLYLDVEHQGSGVAGDLVDAAVGAGPAHLWVLDGNDRAIAFYRKVGFEWDGTVKHDVRLAADEVRMVRRRVAHPPSSGWG